MDTFEKVAQTVIVYKIRSAWFEMAKLYNNMATQYDGTLSMGFALLAINEEEGTPVTKIAPRMGMEPNSLSRLLKSMEEKKLIFRKKDSSDRRKVYICLTDYGKTIRKVAFRAVFTLEKEITHDLPEEKLDAFFEVINHVPKAVARLRDELIMEKEN